MRFDWQKFCTARGIRFETTGPRVSKGNINIHCPWCGPADKSGHMGLSLNQSQPVYGCLRNSQHRGKHPARLVAQLLRIPFTAAKYMVEMEGPQLDDFERALDALRDKDTAMVREWEPRSVDMPPTFRPLGATYSTYVAQFIHYLNYKRGFGTDAHQLVQEYELYYALTGPQAWRLIFPVRDAQGRLQGWTGRAIQQAEIRYLTSEDLPDNALLAFGEPRSMTLVCEGPLDALKLDWYGEPYGIGAVATMGTGRADATKAAALRNRYTALGVVLDADATGQALKFSEELAAPAFFLPPDVKDPGDLSAAQAKIFLDKVAKGS